MAVSTQEKKPRGKVSACKKEVACPPDEALSDPFTVCDIKKSEPASVSLSPPVPSSSSSVLSIPAVTSTNSDSPIKISFKLWPNQQVGLFFL